MRQNGALKTVDDIGDAIGEDRRTTQRLMKLHDLIPQLQTLVSEGRLGTTAGEQGGGATCAYIVAPSSF